MNPLKWIKDMFGSWKAEIATGVTAAAVGMAIAWASTPREQVHHVFDSEQQASFQTQWDRVVGDWVVGTDGVVPVGSNGL